MATLVSNFDGDVRAESSSGLLREGITAGVLGALAVALWFVLVDVVAGRPLYTPALLGAIVAGDGDPELVAEGGRRLTFAALYTPIHFLVFSIFGVIVAALVRQAARVPSIAILLFLVFVAFEVAFAGAVAMLEQGVLGGLAWSQVLVGNLVAAAVMGAYLLRRHPLRQAWSHRNDD